MTSLWVCWICVRVHNTKVSTKIFRLGIVSGDPTNARTQWTCAYVRTLCALTNINKHTCYSYVTTYAIYYHLISNVHLNSERTNVPVQIVTKLVESVRNWCARLEFWWDAVSCFPCKVLVVTRIVVLQALLDEHGLDARHVSSIYRVPLLAKLIDFDVILSRTRLLIFY